MATIKRCDKCQKDTDDLYQVLDKELCKKCYDHLRRWLDKPDNKKGFMSQIGDAFS